MGKVRGAAGGGDAVGWKRSALMIRPLCNDFPELP